MSLHKDMTGADLHEPKGITSATAGQVYKANGTGSGSWQNVVIPSGQFSIIPQLFDTSGTWNKATGCFMLKVTVVGGGGGSGGNGGTTSFGSYVSASGGNSVTTDGAGSTGDLNFTGLVGVVEYGKYGQGDVLNPSGNGGSAIKYVYSVPSSATVTVGAAGTGGTGHAGVVVVEQYVLA